MSVAEETLALEAGDAPVEAARPRGISNVATLLFVAADFMVLIGLVAGYYAVRSQSFTWPPVGLGTYLPTMVALTMGMTVITVQWAVWAISRDDQRTTLAALGITIFFALAILNGQWYGLAHLKFGVGAHPYGTFVYVLTAFHMLNVIAGIVVLFAVLGRTVGGEFSADDHDTLTAAAIFWQFCNVAGLVAFAVLYLHP
ncbi:MAG: heme-copper oxidase subunit III [Acidimicrobiia bacterium]|nr:heme-copper oxidase subunit III [Acidimicrobiia bacterium]